LQRYQQDGGALHSDLVLHAIRRSVLRRPQMACRRRAVRSAKHRSCYSGSPASALGCVRTLSA